MLRTSGFALGYQLFPWELANVNEWKIIFDPSSDKEHQIHIVEFILERKLTVLRSMGNPFFMEMIN